MKRTCTPHDAVFKTFLAHPRTARDFLTLHLPPELLALCDLSTLKLESGSFVEDDLRPYYSDVLYSLKTRAGDGYLQVVIEHQSSPDKHMAFRLMRYAIAAMQRHLDAGHSKLPLVIPVLFYQGKRSPYPYSLRWLDLFCEAEQAAALYNGHFPLIDVTIIPDEEIMQHCSMAALTLLQKHIRQRDLTSLIARLATLMQTEFMTGQQLMSLVNYMLQVGETPDMELTLSELARHVPQHKETFVTIAEQLEQRGMEKGRQLGKHEACLEMARKMLKNNLDRVLVMKITGLTEEDLQQIQRR
ncbi:Rpn family recombination-promoting nuclease/putative transposase [Pantoea septica]|uniref:Rpn family recombination-promoting nuclease/putative transposase n=1 Tax=Pantoea septica TaxID=472695 RepID=UPI00289EFA2B|nr:Rpn family recombination-promoting nuclease/putative transposase [Pantoea septica]